MQQSPEVKKDPPKTVPPKTPDELKTLAVDIFQQKVFTERHITDPSMFGNVFMVAALGGFADCPEEYTQSIGMVYEYLEKAGPRSVNGYPMFMSLQLLNKEDAQKVWDMYFKMKEAVEGIAP